jgi:hypothetical protein
MLSYDELFEFMLITILILVKNLFVKRSLTKRIGIPDGISAEPIRQPINTLLTSQCLRSCSTQRQPIQDPG